MQLNIILLIFFFIPSFLEGLGLWVDRRLFLLYFTCISTFFYLFLSFSSKSLKIPFKVTYLFVLFLFFSLISSLLFSLDKQNSFELFLLFYSSFLLFIFFYNYKKEGVNFIYFFCIILGLFLCAYSFCIPFFQQKNWSFLIPTSEKQFVFPFYNNHNHLGDFIGLPLTIALYYILKEKRYLNIFPFLFCFAVIIITSSRSAYLSCFVLCLILLLYFRKTISAKILPVFFIFLSSLVYIAYIISFPQKTDSFFYKPQKYIETILHSPSRNLLEGHDVFIKQAIFSAIKHPLFGVGGGNFLLASVQHNENHAISDSAHNIFFELAAEQGLLATLFFLLLIGLIIKQILKRPSLSGFLFFYLLFNFQTDYTYQIYSFFLLLIIFGSLSYQENKEFPISLSFYGLFCCIPLIVLTCICTSNLMLKMGRPEQAIQWYPLNKEAYINAIDLSQDNTLSYIEKGEQIAPYDGDLILISADFFLRQGNKSKALSYYEKIYELNKYCSFYFVEQIYQLKKDVYSRKEADYFLQRVVYYYRHWNTTHYFRNMFSEFCKKAEIEECPEIE